VRGGCDGIISVVGGSGGGKTTFLLTDIDIILIEGYKGGDAPKIEVLRQERGGGLLCAPDELVAIAGIGCNVLGSTLHPSYNDLREGSTAMTA